MDQFTSNIAAVLEIAVIAAGLYVLALSKKEGSGLIRAAGILLVAGGIVVASLTTYYWIKYQATGEFDGCDSMMCRHGMMRGGPGGPGSMHGMMHGPGGMMGGDTVTPPPSPDSKPGQ